MIRIETAATGTLPLSQRNQLPQCSAVYFVNDGDDLLYIGSARNLRTRWRCHHRAQQFPNGAILAWVEVSFDDLRDTEKALIASMHPRLNGQRLPPYEPPAPFVLLYTAQQIAKRVKPPTELLRLRLHHCLQANAVAAEAEIAASHLSLLEQRKRQPSLDVAKRLARFYERTIEEVFPR